MNRYMMVGRSNLGHQRVDVHAVAQFWCDVSRFVKWITHNIGL